MGHGCDGDMDAEAGASVTVFAAVEHLTGECLGIHAEKYGSRHEALEPIRQRGKRVYDEYDANVAAGLLLRHDHGSQFVSHDFQAELTFLGIESSPSFVRSPEGMELLNDSLAS